MTWLIKIEVEKFEVAQKLVKAIEDIIVYNNEIVDMEYEELEDDL